MSAPSPNESLAARLRAAESVLAEQGLAGARVEALGDAGEMAVLDAPQGELALERVEAVVGALRALGFRHVTLDLG